MKPSERVGGQLAEAPIDTKFVTARDTAVDLSSLGIRMHKASEVKDGATARSGPQTSPISDPPCMSEIT
jgi:hypothetical protein